MNGQTKLYTPELLAASVRLAHYPLSGPFALEADARSPTCGSTLKLGLECDAEGRIASLGIRAQACAVGQAAAALFAAGAAGKAKDDIDNAARSIRLWLEETDAPRPDWPGIALLAPARAYPGRHGAIMLAWDAALRALSKPTADR